MARRFASLGAIVPLLFGLLAATFVPRPAHAVALYDAWADASVTLLGFKDEFGNPIAAPAGLSIIADATVFDSTTDAFGTGNANTDGGALGTTSNMLIGDSVALSSRSFGDAQLPDGGAFSFHDTEGFIEIDNLSSQTVRADFEIFYDWSLAIAVADLDKESAFADLYIDILGGVCGCAPDVDVLIEEALDSLDLAAPGSPGASGTDTFVFSILLLPGDFAAIDMFVGTLGFADAFEDIAVPAPAGLAIIVPALLLIGTLRLRPRTA